MKRKKSKIINLIKSVLVFALCCLALVTVVFAWYALSVENKVSGITLSAQSPQIIINDTVTVKRGFDGKEEEKIEITFKRDADGVYYEYDEEEGDYIYAFDGEGNEIKKPLSLKGLWPGESVDFYIPVNKENASDALLVNLRLENFSGDYFLYSEGGEDVSYSVLSVYRVNAFDGDGNMLGDVWLDSYGGSNIISNQPWGEGEEQIVMHFKITFDLSRFEIPGNIKDLSEKRFSIGRIIITVAEN